MCARVCKQASDCVWVNLWKSVRVSMGVSWGPKQGYFWNVNWVCAPQLAVPKLGTQVFWLHLSLKTASCGAYAYLPAAWTPLFTTNLSYLTTNWPDLCHFVWTVYILIKNSIATNMGRNGAVVGQVPHFGPFPFQKSAKGVPKRMEYQVPPNPDFSILNNFSS